MNSLILVAAGSGARMGDPQNKLLSYYDKKPLLYYTLRNVFESKFLSELIVVTKPDEKEIVESIVEEIPHNVRVIYADGGKERFDSVRNGLDQVSSHSKKLLIHDGARPLVDGGTIDFAFQSITENTPAVMVGISSVDTIKKVQNGNVVKTLERNEIYRAQTPQGSWTELYRTAIGLIEDFSHITDDAAILEEYGVKVKVIPGKESFFKVTHPEDKMRFRRFLHQMNLPFRIGSGYDIHQVEESRKLILGGVEIQDHHGLRGHSDADCLLHAIMDGMLGALGLPDIGHYFPDTDPTYEGSDSTDLLRIVSTVVEEHGYRIGNIDSTVIAEKPKLAPFIPKMKQRISQILKISEESISIKATTNEKLGPIGRCEGIAAISSVMLYRRDM